MNDMTLFLDLCLLYTSALAEEIVQGNGSKLMPNDSCTRAQIVTFLFRAYQDK